MVYGGSRGEVDGWGDYGIDGGRVDGLVVRAWVGILSYNEA